MILNRYLFFEFFRPFTFSVIVLSFLIQMGHLFDRLPVFMSNKVEIKVIVVYLFSMLPLWLIQALPICTLIAGVIALGNMTKSGELLCLRSSGLSTLRILKPFYLFAFLLTVLTFILGDSLMPRATSHGRTLYRTYVDKIGIQKTVWYDIVVLAKDKKRISMKKLDLEKNEMENVTVEEYGDTFNLRQSLTAQKAEWNETKGWMFYDGVVRLFSKMSDEIIEEEPFAAAQLVLPEKPSDLVPQQIWPEELSIRQLKQYIRKINDLGIPALREKVQFHLKFAFPLTHILVLTIGVPIALKTTLSGGGRGQKGFGQVKSIALATVVGLGYFMLIGAGQALGETRKLPPWIAVWIANFVFAILGIYLLKKMD